MCFKNKVKGGMEKKRRITAAAFKTRTANDRIAKTTVFMPTREMVVINRRILAKEEDMKNGWFKGTFPIYCYKDFVLIESEMVFWVDSFKTLQTAFEKLNRKYTGQNGADNL